MAQHINHRNHRSQHGQAMVEYAILLVVAFLFMFGAAELTSAGFNSYKTSEGAKAGAVEYVAVRNEYRRYLDESGNQTIIDIEQEILSLENQLNAEEANIVAPDNDLDNNGVLDNNETYLGMLARALTGIDINNDGIINKNDLTLETINLALSNNLQSAYTSTDPINDPNIYVQLNPNHLPATEAIKESLLIAQRNKLDLVNNIGLLELADHDPASNNQITSPQCVGNDYDYGLGGRYVDPEKYPAYFEEGVTNQIYLFNPLPIDSETCVGKDPDRDDRSRISILVGGYYKPPPADQNLNVPGLPKLNQAMYSQYTKVCLEGNDYVLDQACSNGTLLLKPPGKLCLADDPDSEGCPGVDNDPDRPISGYYFFGGDTTPEIEPEFRPTFQIECNNEGFTSELVMTEGCLQPAENIFSLRIHTRYRYVFDSFVPFGAAEMNDESLIPYYYNPGRMGKSGSNNLVGAAGSELGPVGDTGLPTIKPFRDFRGCHEVDLSTNQISACN